jgi:hypothetical protein
MGRRSDFLLRSQSFFLPSCLIEFQPHFQTPTEVATTCIVVAHHSGIREAPLIGVPVPAGAVGLEFKGLREAPVVGIYFQLRFLIRTKADVVCMVRTLSYVAGILDSLGWEAQRLFRQNGFYEITELFGGEFVSFQVGNQASAAVYHSGMERVVH